MATLDKDGVPLYKLEGATYRADELQLRRADGYYTIHRKSDDAEVATTNQRLLGVAVA